MRKGFALPLILAIITIVLVAVGTIAYFQFKSKSSPQTQPPEGSQPTPSPIVIPKETPSPTTNNETVNWKTYTNAEFGVTFKYPKEWFVLNDSCPNNSSNELIILDKEKDPNCLMSLEGPYTFAILVEKQNYDLNQQIKGRDGFTPIGDSIMVGGVKAVKVYPIFRAFYGRIEIYLNHKSNGLMITFPNIDYKGNYDPVADKILSTFQFID